MSFKESSDAFWERKEDKALKIRIIIIAIIILLIIIYSVWRWYDLIIEMEIPLLYDTSYTIFDSNCYME